MIAAAPFSFLLGLSIGSFLNVLVDRLPKGESILGRSHCDYCKKKIAWYDLFPLVSFFLIRGRCRYCNRRLSYYYPLVEFLTGLVFVGVFLKYGSVDIFFNPPEFGILTAWLVLFSSLIVIFFADLKYRLIPDSMQFMFLVSAFSVRILSQTNAALGGWPMRVIPELQAGVIAGLFVMAPILFLFLVTRGKGMGFGDVKYAFGMGVLLGTKGGYMALYFGFVLGAVVGVALLVAGKKGFKSKIAFGPFLVAATVLVSLFFETFSRWMSSLYGL